MTLPRTMKAAIVSAYGGPEIVRIEPRPLPRLADDAILVRVHAATVDTGDARLRALDAPAGMGLAMRLVTGLTRPRQPVFGTAASGTVAAIGPRVTRFAVSDEVIAFSGISQGCHAEYVALPENKPIVKKPGNLGFPEAAALCFGGTTALDFLRKAGLKPGEQVLVIGASGAVGSAMVQLAKHADARVTAAASAANADLVARLGADTVIDYATNDYTRHRETYDVIADTVGASTFTACLPALRAGGRYLAISGGLGDMLARPRDGKRPIAGMAGELRADVQHLADLAARKNFRPLIDSTFPLDAIAEAHARVDSRHKRGSVVIAMIADQYDLATSAEDLP